MIADLKPYPAYKPSGVPWLESIPVHWHTKRGKYVFHTIDVRSKTGQEELLTVSAGDGVVPRRQKTVTMFMAESYVGYKLCWPGDLVINSLWAWMQGLGFSRHYGIVSSAYGVYRPKEKYSTCWRYLDYLLRSKAYDWDLHVRSKGIWLSRLQLTDEAFLDIPVILPPPKEAERITRFLSHHDRLTRRYIRAKQKLIKLLKEQKQVIIHRAVTRGLDPNVRLKPSGVKWLGDVPAHWEVKRLHQITDPNRPVMYGIVLPGPNVDDGVYIVKGGNCEPGRLRPERLSRTTFEIESRYTRSRLVADDIVFAIRGGVGAAELVPPELAGANLTQDAARIAAGTGVHPRWLLQAVRAPIFREHVASQVVGATVRGINIRSLKRIEVVVPPLEEQEEIVQYIEDPTNSILTALERAQREINLLREYRTRLIADVVTGKVDVRELAAGLPEVEERKPLDDALLEVEAAVDDDGPEPAEEDAGADD